MVHGAKSRKGQVQDQEPSPKGVTRDALIPLFPPASNYDNTCEVLSTKEAHRNSMPKISIGAWLDSHLPPSAYQNSILPEEKQLMSINYIICTISAQTATLSQGGGSVPET